MSEAKDPLFYCTGCSDWFDREVFHCAHCNHHSLPEFVDGCKYCDWELKTDARAGVLARAATDEDRAEYAEYMEWVASGKGVRDAH